MQITDSPFLWSGKKTKLLPQILPIFPEGKYLVDLFGGTGVISANSKFKKVVYNDLFMGNIINTIAANTVVDILAHIDKQIKKYGLNKTNKENYYIFKKTITGNPNHNNNYYLDAITLSLFAFNGMLEFNKSGGVTSSFGKRNRRKVFEPILIDFKNSIDTLDYIRFDSLGYIECIQKIIVAVQSNKVDANDIFVYVDPPYSITRINGYKSDYNDTELFTILTQLDRLGIKWGMSNVLSHKGIQNLQLIEFSKSHNVHHLNFDYTNTNNSNIQEKLKSDVNVTDEVFICNYIALNC